MIDMKGRKLEHGSNFADKPKLTKLDVEEKLGLEFTEIYRQQQNNLSCVDT